MFWREIAFLFVGEVEFHKYIDGDESSVLGVYDLDEPEMYDEAFERFGSGLVDDVHAEDGRVVVMMVV